MEKETNYLTIVIAYYNIRFFKETLQSLKNQSDKRFKVFIGNDNSPDDPKYLIDRYLIDVDYEYVSFDTNLGGEDLTKQWKRCLDYVKTPYFLILGDDDFISVNTVESFNKMMKNFYGRKVFRLTIQKIDGNTKNISGLIIYEDDETSVDFAIKCSRNEVRNSLGEYIFFTEEYHRFGIRPYPKAFFSDNMMILEYSHFGGIKNIEDAISFIRLSDYSFSGNKQNSKYLYSAATMFYYDLFNEYYDKFKGKDTYFFILCLFLGIDEKSNPYRRVDLFKILFKNNEIQNLYKFYRDKLKRFYQRNFLKIKTKY